MLLVALLAVSCSKEEVHSERGVDYAYGKDLTHEMIVLGDRLENPYKTENIKNALKSWYPTKADRVDVKTTDLYVRFLPSNDQEYEALESMGIHLVDHPLDYDILVDGDWYHDPVVPEGEMTWQYAVVGPDFKFPDIKYEIIDECFIAEHNTGTRADEGVDWEAVERQSYILTGNADKVPEPMTKASGKVIPSGRITIVDDHANGGKPFGVAGVKISCNSFVKFDHCYTDRDGYYQMKNTFSSDLRYRLVFENEKGFSIGFNLILLPASVSTLGKSGPEGINMTITKDSEEKLFRRCVVNNAAYDYYTRCSPGDMNIAAPPADLRIWLFHTQEKSSAVMLHQGAFFDSEYLSPFLGAYASLIEVFAPDVTLGMEGKKDYRSLYSITCHELSHASHFTKVGTEYWNKYIAYILTSFVKTGGLTYGDGLTEGAGYCEIGEMWGYYMESKTYKDRYGGSFPTFGTSYWFSPQIFRYLDERGIVASEIFAVLDGTVTSKSSLKNALLLAYPAKRTVIEQVFNRYK